MTEIPAFRRVRQEDYKFKKGKEEGQKTKSTRRKKRKDHLEEIIQSGDVAHMVEHLPSKQEALSSNP
jgi:hypothetical protein